MDATKSLTEIVTWLFDETPLALAEVEDRARLLFLDTLGCMIAGLAKPELKAMNLALARLEQGPIALPGAAAPLSLNAAAYLAGVAACWDEACEGLPRAHGRPGLHSFAASLPLGLAREVTFGDMLAALVAGYEVAGRLGEMLRIPPGMHVDGTWGSFGAVTATARLLSLAPEAAVAALQGAACQLPWSLYLPIAQGSDVRNSYVGEAARRGIMAVLAVQAGITTPSGAIETFDRLALGGDPASKTLAPAREWFLLQGYLKPFAAVRHVHYGAQAAIEWRRQHGANGTAAIKALELSIYREAMTYCGNRAPKTAIQAQFSLSYGLAWALVHGDLGPEAYSIEALNDPEVRRLENLVAVTEDSLLSQANRRAATLTVSSASSSEAIPAVSVPGDPELPLTAAEVKAKFQRYASAVIGFEPAESLAAAILERPLSMPLAGLLAYREQAV